MFDVFNGYITIVRGSNILKHERKDWNKTDRHSNLVEIKCKLDQSLETLPNLPASKNSQSHTYSVHELPTTAAVESPLKRMHVVDLTAERLM